MTVALILATGLAAWVGWLVHSAVMRNLALFLGVNGLILGALGALLFFALGLYKLVHSLIFVGSAAVSVAWLVFAAMKWGVRFLYKAIGILLVVGCAAFLGVIIVRYWPSVALFLARLMAALAFAGVASILIFSFRYIWRIVFAEWFQVKKFPPGTFTPDAWKKLVSNVGPDRQEALLGRTDHQTLSLTVPDYLSVLKEIRAAFKVEPAISAYWEHRHRIEEALRQERQG